MRCIDQFLAVLVSMLLTLFITFINTESTHANRREGTYTGTEREHTENIHGNRRGGTYTGTEREHTENIHGNKTEGTYTGTVREHTQNIHRKRPEGVIPPSHGNFHHNEGNCSNRSSQGQCSARARPRRPRRSVLSESEITTVLETHNLLRREEGASNMNTLVWLTYI